MASAFWNSNGILLINYLEKGRTINSDYNCAFLDRLEKKSQENGLIFLQDNASAHKSIKTMPKINELHFELPPHPPYYPDLAPSVFCLLLNLKIWLQRQRFSSNEEFKWKTHDYFGGFDESYYKRGIEMLNDRWTKCIELKGDYVKE